MNWDENRRDKEGKGKRRICLVGHSPSVEFNAVVDDELTRIDTNGQYILQFRVLDREKEKCMRLQLQWVRTT